MCEGCNAVSNADAIWKSKLKCNERNICGLLVGTSLLSFMESMSFRTGVLQSGLECSTSGDAKTRFLFLEQPIVLSCQEVSATLSILFGQHSSCKVPPSAGDRSLITSRRVKRGIYVLLLVTVSHELRSCRRYGCSPLAPRCDLPRTHNLIIRCHHRYPRVVLVIALLRSSHLLLSM